MTTRSDIHRWLDEGKKKGATHMIVVCDTFDYDDYPKYVMPGMDIHEVTGNLGSMQSLMEVYSYALPLDEQLAEHRAFHYD